jgi:hypothetical protein
MTEKIILKDCWSLNRLTILPASVLVTKTLTVHATAQPNRKRIYICLVALINFLKLSIFEFALLNNARKMAITIPAFKLTKALIKAS